MGYRYENSDIVGEFFINHGDTPEGFSQRFREKFGTDPEISAAIYQVENNAPIPTAEPLSLSGEEFRAAPINQDRLNDIILPEPDTLPNGIVIKPQHSWTPETVDASVMREKGSQHFILKMSWGANKPTNLDHKFGIEFEVNLYNNAEGTRPFCGANAGDEFLAKRQNWHNWYAMVPRGVNIGAAKPYADYNDLSDSCGLNSMAIGVRWGDKFPPMSNGKFSLITGIEAPIGTASSNRVGGVIQSVDNVSCITNRHPSGVTLTDCMGLNGDSAGSQIFLNVSRNWVANPNLCWVSKSYGTTPPTRLTC